MSPKGDPLSKSQRKHSVWKVYGRFGDGQPAAGVHSRQVDRGVPPAVALGALRDKLSSRRAARALDVKPFRSKKRLKLIALARFSWTSAGFGGT